MGGVQKAKWLDELVIVMGLTDGTVQMKDIRTKKEEKASEMITRRDAAICDIGLWKTEQGV